MRCFKPKAALHLKAAPEFVPGGRVRIGDRRLRDEPVFRPSGPVCYPLTESIKMAVKIRLRREGRKKTPMYRIVVADSKAPRDGRFIEILGQYQPRGGENAIALKAERVNHWLDVGALPTDTVRSLLRRAGILKARHEARLASKLQAAAVKLPEA